MRKIKIKALKPGKQDRTAIYALSNTGNVYKLKQPVPVEKHKRLAEMVKKADFEITLKLWTKVKVAEPRVANCWPKR